MDNEIEKKKSLLNKIDGMSWKQLVTIKYAVEMGAQFIIAILIFGFMISIVVAAVYSSDSDKETTIQGELFKATDPFLANVGDQMKKDTLTFQQEMQAGDNTSHEPVESPEQKAAEAQIEAQEAANDRWRDEQSTMVTNESIAKNTTATSNQP